MDDDSFKFCEMRKIEHEKKKENEYAQNEVMTNDGKRRHACKLFSKTY